MNKELWAYINIRLIWYLKLKLDFANNNSIHIRIEFFVKILNQTFSKTIKYEQNYNQSKKYLINKNTIFIIMTKIHNDNTITRI